MTDEEMALRGDFEELYRRHRAGLYQFLRRQAGEQADDLFQTAWLKAFRALGTFRAQSTFKTWLFTIAANCVLDDRRAASRRRAVELTEEAASVEPEPPSEDAETLRRALDALPPRHKALVLLVRFHGMKVADAAAAVGLSPASGKVTLFRILRRLGGLITKVMA
jgi:RNA polymerase sigma-70 factor (ECF subfamily)